MNENYDCTVGKYEAEITYLPSSLMHYYQNIAFIQSLHHLPFVYLNNV